MHNVTETSARARASRIVAIFVDLGGFLAVNISAVRRNKIETKVKDLEAPLEQDLFSAAVEDVTNMLFNDSYRRYVEDKLRRASRRVT